MALEPPVKHLLVDLDGTLLGNRGLALSADFVRQAMAALKKQGAGIKQVARLAIGVQSEFRRPSALLTNDMRVLAVVSKLLNLTVEESRKIIRDSLVTIFPSLEKHFYPIDGARDFLEWAKDHYTLTLATNPVWPPEIVELRVRWAGVDPSIFTRITHARSMHACKPALAYYEEILQQQGLRPEDCLLIGNDLKMDLPAVRAGIRVFIIEKKRKPGPHPEPLKLAGAKALAWKGNYTDLRTLLDERQAQAAPELVQA